VRNNKGNKMNQVNHLKNLKAKIEAEFKTKNPSLANILAECDKAVAEYLKDIERLNVQNRSLAKKMMRNSIAPRPEYKRDNNPTYYKK